MLSGYDTQCHAHGDDNDGFGLFLIQSYLPLEPLTLDYIKERNKWLHRGIVVSGDRIILNRYVLEQLSRYAIKLKDWPMKLNYARYYKARIGVAIPLNWK